MGDSVSAAPGEAGRAPPARPEAAPAGPSAIDPSRWVEDHGDILWRFAMSRTPSAHEAEEAIQEAFEAALRAKDTFRGECTERTWLIAILRRRLADRARRAGRRAERGASLSLLDSMFDGRGRWKEGPGTWPRRPQETAGDPEFLADLERCLSRLPAGLAEAFVLREVHAHPPEGVCRALSITIDNLWVRLHRARVLLRRCLEPAWGGTRRRP